MPTPAGAPLRKVTLNLYEDDCAFLEQSLGRGWTAEARDAIHAYAVRLGQPTTYQRLTLGDLK